MTLEEIKTAVAHGKTVHWSNEYYDVICDKHNQWLIKGLNGHCIGLTWQDGVTMNGKPEEFYIDTAKEKRIQERKIRAYALAHVLCDAFRDMMTTWYDGDDELDEMLEPNFPFNMDFSDQWAAVQRWVDAMPDPHPKPEPEPEEKAVIYLFTDGYYRGEFQNWNSAAIEAYERCAPDKKQEVMNSDTPAFQYFQNDDDHRLNDVEILGNLDYEFHQGKIHPSRKLYMKEGFDIGNYVDAEFTLFDDDRDPAYYKGKHYPPITWNGWACPYFSKEVAMQMMNDLPEGAEITCKYDEENDTFTYHNEITDDVDVFESVFFEDGIPMYPIGAFMWTWSTRDVTPPVPPTEPEYNELNFAIKFPNGVTSWIETHHEVVCAMAAAEDVEGSITQQQHEAGGTGRMYELAEELTDKFETMYAGETWEEKDFYDTIWAFCQENLVGPAQIS